MYIRPLQTFVRLVISWNIKNKLINLGRQDFLWSNKLYSLKKSTVFLSLKVNVIATFTFQRKTLAKPNMFPELLRWQYERFEYHHNVETHLYKLIYFMSGSINKNNSQVFLTVTSCWLVHRYSSEQSIR